MGLSGSTVVGGAVVQIGADLSALVAAESQAKAIVARIGALKASAMGGGGMGGGMGPGAPWMSNIMPTGSGAHALGGGTGTAMMGGGMSTMDATFRRLAASGTAASVAIDAMAAAAGTAAAALASIVVGPGGSGSGGSGTRGGNAAAKGGLGRKNLFSNRGVAGLLGIGLTGVFAALEGLKIGTALANNADLSAHPERTLNAINQTSRYGVRGDETLRGVASATDRIAQEKTTQQTFESVPLVGTLVKFVNAVNGSTSALEEQGKILGRIQQSHEEALAGIVKNRVAYAARHGDVGADEIETLEDELRAKEKRARDEDYRNTMAAVQNDQKLKDYRWKRKAGMGWVAAPALLPTDHAAQEDLAGFQKEHDAKLADIYERQSARKSNVGVLDSASRKQLESMMWGGEAAHLKSNYGDSGAIYELRQLELRARHSSEASKRRAEYEESRAGKKFYEKQGLYFQRQRDLAQEGEKEKYDFDQLRDERDREIRDAGIRSSNMVASGGAASLRMSHRQFAAGELQHRAAFDSEIGKINNPVEKAAKYYEYYQEAQERKQTERFRKADVMERYRLQIGDAQLTMSGGEHAQEISAGHTISEIKRDIRDARDGDERRQAVIAGQARIEEAIYNIRAVNGGAFGITTNRNMIVGDPLDLSGTARDRDAAERKLREGRGGLDDPKKNDPAPQGWWNNVLTALNGILAKDNPAIAN